MVHFAWILWKEFDIISRRPAHGFPNTRHLNLRSSRASISRILSCFFLRLSSRASTLNPTHPAVPPSPLPSPPPTHSKYWMWRNLSEIIGSERRHSDDVVGRRHSVLAGFKRKSRPPFTLFRLQSKFWQVMNKEFLFKGQPQCGGDCGGNLFLNSRVLYRIHIKTEKQS